MNTSIKRPEWLNGYKHQDPSVYCQPEVHYRAKETNTQTDREKVEKDIPCKWKSKYIVITILISDKTDFKIKEEELHNERRALHNDKGAT